MSWNNAGSEWWEPSGEKELKSSMLLCGWSCVLMAFPAIWHLCGLREVPTVTAGHSWISCHRGLLWNLPQLMVQSCPIYQSQPVIHNSKFWLSHEEIRLFNSSHRCLLLKNPFLWEGLWGFCLRQPRECKAFFSPQANSTLLVFGWK